MSFYSVNVALDIHLFDKNCNSKFSFPAGYRNNVRWDPFGPMVALGGFGNLAGILRRKKNLVIMSKKNVHQKRQFSYDSYTLLDGVL